MYENEIKDRKEKKTYQKIIIVVVEAFLKKQEKSQINNLTYHLKELGKRRTNKIQSQQKEGNNKDQREDK